VLLWSIITCKLSCLCVYCESKWALMALHSHTCHALSRSKQSQVRSCSCCLSSDVHARPTLRNYTVYHFEIIINYVHPLYVGKMRVIDRAVEKLWWNKYYLACNLQHQKRNLHTCTAMCNEILKHFLKLLPCAIMWFLMWKK